MNKLKPDAAGPRQTSSLSSRLMDMKFMKHTQKPTSGESSVEPSPSPMPASPKPTSSVDSPAEAPQAEDPGAWSIPGRPVSRPTKQPEAISFSDLAQSKLGGRRRWRKGKCEDVAVLESQVEQVDEEEVEKQKSQRVVSASKRKGSDKSKPAKKKRTSM